MGCTFAAFQCSRLKTLSKLEVLSAPGDAMTELFIARKDDQFFQLSKVPISSDADTDSKYFLLQDSLLLALEVLNVPTQDYKRRISDSKE